MRQRFALSNAQLTKRAARHASEDENEARENPYKAVFYVDDQLDQRRWRISRTVHAASAADARRLRDELRIGLEDLSNPMGWVDVCRGWREMPEASAS